MDAGAQVLAVGQPHRPPVRRPRPRLPLSEGGLDLLNRAARWTERWREPILRAGLALASLGGLLVFTSRLNDPFALPKLLATALGACLSWAGLCLSRDGRSLPRTPLDVPLAWLAGAAVLSALFSLDKPVSLLGQYYSYSFGLLPWLLAAAVFYAAAAFGGTQARPTERYREEVPPRMSGARPTERYREEVPPRMSGARPVLSTGAALAGVLGLYGLLQRLGVEPLLAAAPLMPREEACGTAGNPVDLAAYLVALLPAAVRLSFSEEPAAPAAKRLGRVSSVLAGLCLLAGGSYAAMLAGLVAGALALLLTRPAALKRLDPKAAAWGLALALLAGPLVAARLQRPPDEARLKTWAVAARTVLHRPLTGTGPDTLMLAFRRYRSEDVIRALGDRRGGITANNDLLQVAATLGLAGLAAYLFFLLGLWRLFRDALGDPGRRELAAAAAASAAGLFVYAKYYALPPPVLACAAAGAGFVARRPGRGGPAPRLRRAGAWAALAGTVMACVLLGRYCAADAAQARALRALAASDTSAASTLMERACRLAPFEMHYKVALNRLLIEMAPTEAPGEAPTHYPRAVELGRSAVRWHPRDPAAYNMLGVSLFLLSSLGPPDRLAEAQKALDRAHELDPYFLPLWQARLVVAAKRNDRKLFDELWAGLQRVVRLLPEDQKPELPAPAPPEGAPQTPAP